MIITLDKLDDYLIIIPEQCDVDDISQFAITGKKLLLLLDYRNSIERNYYSSILRAELVIYRNTSGFGIVKSRSTPSTIVLSNWVKEYFDYLINPRSLSPARLVKISCELRQEVAWL